MQCHAMYIYVIIYVLAFGMFVFSFMCVFWFWYAAFRALCFHCRMHFVLRGHCTTQYHSKALRCSGYSDRLFPVIPSVTI